MTGTNLERKCLLSKKKKKFNLNNCNKKIKKNLVVGTDGLPTESKTTIWSNR